MVLPESKKKNKKDEDGDGDETSDTSSIEPRNLSYSSNRAKVPKSPAKRKKAAGAGLGAMPPRMEIVVRDRITWWLDFPSSVYATRKV